MPKLQQLSLAWQVFLFGGLALCATILIGVIGLLAPHAARAQDLGLEITKSLVGSRQVQVGAILEFTIRITNTGTVPITELQVVDEFVGSIVAPAGSGIYARPGDPPLSDTQPYTYDGAETITWDLLGGGQQLAAGESLAITVRLRAIRPTSDLQVVNRARIERAVRNDGSQSGGGAAEAPAQPAGARLPMTKSLGVPVPVRVGQPITFTIVITNDGAVELTSLPLRDIYNPAALRFVSASPPPSAVNEPSGLLEWDDLLEITGRGLLRPGEAIRITTVYIALQNVRGAVNQADVSGARDLYGNDIESSQAEVPIFIVGPDETATTEATADATATTAATSTPQPDEEDQPERSSTPTSAPTLAASVTSAAPSAPFTSATVTTTPEASVVSTSVAETITPTSAASGGAGGENTPASLPKTGTSGDLGPWLFAALILLLAGGLALRRR